MIQSAIYAGILVLGLALGLFGARGYYAPKLDHLQASMAADRAVASAAQARAQQELKEQEVQRADLEKKLTQRVAKVVTRPVYRNVCIDDDGLRIANDALAHRTPAARADGKLPVP